MSDDLVKQGYEIFERGEMVDLPEDVRIFGKEAADEIERLQADIGRILEDAPGAIVAAALAERKRAEAAEAKIEEWKAMALAYQLDKEEAEAEVARLREALQPFADYADRADEIGFSDALSIRVHPNAAPHNRPTVGDCRKARQALAQQEKDNG